MHPTPRTVAMVGLGLVVGAVLTAAVPVYAATSQLVRVVDAVTGSTARVDAGRLRVGDGSGPMTVNGSVSTSNGDVVLTGQVTLGTGQRSVKLTMPVPGCPTTQRFSVDFLSVSPSPADNPDGVNRVPVLSSWGAFIPLAQSRSGGASRASELAVGQILRPTPLSTWSQLESRVTLPAPIPVTLGGGAVQVVVKLLDFSTAGGPVVFNVHLGGRCATPFVAP